MCHHRVRSNSVALKGTEVIAEELCVPNARALDALGGLKCTERPRRCQRWEALHQDPQCRDLGDRRAVHALAPEAHAADDVVAREEVVLEEGQGRLVVCAGSVTTRVAQNENIPASTSEMRPGSTA